jgi:alkylhydroperoxidase/carboxymuconolactone decarboxylase family protein YurZ
MATPYEQHYLETLGHVPLTITAMFDMEAGLAESYTDARRLYFQERADGLPVAIKELLIVILDIASGHVSGAVAHLQAAKRAGLTETQLKEGLIAAYLIHGGSSWDTVGRALWEWWREDSKASR